MSTQEVRAVVPQETAEIKLVRAGYARGAPIPWPLKMTLKIVLAKLRFSYGFWSRLGIFRHGDLGSDFRSLKQGFLDHLNYYKSVYGTVPKRCLELGPGDSIGHALAAKAAGVEEVWLVDVSDFATKDPAHYSGFYDYLRKEGAAVEPAPPSFERAAVEAYCNAHYKTRGLQSLKDIPADQMDFSFSHAVLEHVARDEFADTMKELFRTHKKGSVSRHWVDLHDHLGGALNSFRFPASFWESAAVREAGFYTNRLTMNEMIGMAEDAGFTVVVHKVVKWESLPTPRGAIHKDFYGLSEQDLNICTFLMCLHKD